MKKDFKNSVKKVAVMALMAGMLVTSGFSGVKAEATTTHEWYLYYNDSNVHYTTASWEFMRYNLHTYTARPETRSASNVYTLVQAGTNVTLAKASYLVAGSPVSIYQTEGIGQHGWLITKLSYNTRPASTSGTLSD
jgi:hypothetical protein